MDIIISDIPDATVYAGAKTLGVNTDGTEKLFNLATITGVDSMLDLRHLAPVTSTDSVYLTGYWTKGDAGAGVFYWNATSTGTYDRGTIITRLDASGNEITTPGRWLRVIPAGTNHAPEWYGVKGDGSNEGELLAYVLLLGRDLVFRGSRRTYCTDRQLAITRERQVLDFNWGVLQMADGYSIGTNPMLVLQGAFQRIRNITLTGSAANTSDGILISAQQCRIQGIFAGSTFQNHAIRVEAVEATIEDGRIKGALTGSGVRLNSYDSNLRNLYIEGCYEGVSNQSGNGSLVMYNVHCFNNRTGFHFDGGGEMQIVSCYADTNTYRGWQISNTGNSSFVDCWGFKSGALESGEDWYIEGTSEGNSFITCRGTQNQSTDPNTVSFHLGDQPNNYIGCFASTVGNYSLNAKVQNGFLAFEQYNSSTGINTGDETNKSVITKFDLRDTYYTVPTTITPVSGNYTVNIPDLIGRRPIIRVWVNNVGFRPRDNASGTTADVSYNQTTGNLVFKVAINAGDVISISHLSYADSVPAPYVADLFARTGDLAGTFASDGELSKAWSVNSADGLGTWITTGNSVYCNNESSSSRCSALVPCLADGTLEVTAIAVKTSVIASRYMKLAFRAISPDSYLYVDASTDNVWKLMKRTGPTTSATLHTSTITPASGDIVRVVMVGSTISYYINSILQGTVTDTFNVAVNNHGFIGTAATDHTSKWGNFKFTEL